jgi:hypothetical protein
VDGAVDKVRAEKVEGIFSPPSSARAAFDEQSINARPEFPMALKPCTGDKQPRRRHF